MKKRNQEFTVHLFPGNSLLCQRCGRYPDSPGAVSPYRPGEIVSLCQSCWEELRQRDNGIPREKRR